MRAAVKPINQQVSRLLLFSTSRWIARFAALLSLLFVPCGPGKIIGSHIGVLAVIESTAMRLVLSFVLPPLSSRGARPVFLQKEKDGRVDLVDRPYYGRDRLGNLKRNHEAICVIGVRWRGIGSNSGRVPPRHAFSY